MLSLGNKDFYRKNSLASVALCTCTSIPLCVNLPLIYNVIECEIMAGSVNKVILIGNLGADPEIRSTQDGREIANLNIATSESWKDKNSGERKDKTEWHRVVIFTPGLVNVVKQYLKKGAKVYVEGALQTRKWKDQSGADRYSTEVVLQGFNSILTMLDGRGGAGGSGGESYAPSYSGSQSENSFSSSNNSTSSKEAFAVEELDDEIPF